MDMTAHMFASVPPNSSTLMPVTTATTVTTNTSIITLVRTLIAHDTLNNTYKAISATTNIIIDTSVNISTPKPTISSVSGSIATPANPTIVKPMHSASGDTFMTTSPHPSDSAPVSARERGKLIHVILYLSLFRFDLSLE